MASASSKVKVVTDGLPQETLGRLFVEPADSVESAVEASLRETIGWVYHLLALETEAERHLRRALELREELYTAYTTRASDQGPHAGQWDNTDTMEQIMALRHEAARLLDYSNYAERSLATKMAESTEQVMGFLEDLAQRSRPAATRELQEVRDFARTQFQQDELQAWDIAYYSEKLRQDKYAISQEELKPYFPEPVVVSGLFAIVGKLYGLQIEAVEGVDTWHKDVAFYRIHDEAGTLRGEFYLDLYARPHKRGGAWMDECISRRRGDAGLQTPVAYLTCNFSPPIGDQPALFTHDEVITLFHEFGHGLHHMLTQVDYTPVSGISGVAWDAVELPSQFMENWCWEREALDLFSGHFETGAKIPGDLYERMQAAKNFQSAMQMVRQLEFAIFDLRIHRDYHRDRGACIHDTLNEVRKQVAVVQPPAFNRFENGFTHIFGGGYAAGYYSYKWAEVLAADAFEAETAVLAKLTALLPPGGDEKAHWKDEIVAEAEILLADLSGYPDQQPSPLSGSVDLRVGTMCTFAMLAALLMSVSGPAGFFWCLAGVHTAIGLFALYRMLQRAPVPLDESWTECPPELAALVHRCLQKDPEERYASCNELIRDVDESFRNMRHDGVEKAAGGLTTIEEKAMGNIQKMGRNPVVSVLKPAEATPLSALALADQPDFPIDMVIISAGIRPRDELARDPIIWWNLASASAALFGLILAVNLAIDLLYRFIDPRVARR